MPHISVEPERVHETLGRNLLTAGLPIVLDLAGSHGSFVRDAKTSEDYLDFSSFYASNPLGFAPAAFADSEFRERLALAARVKVANSDYYTTYFAEFVATLASTAAPASHPHFFFVDGGALAVENAMKVAFDWKVRKNVASGRGALGAQILHFEQAFHGRSGYTLSVTNTDPTKTLHFPKFDWPRLVAPARSFPETAVNQAALVELERAALGEVSRAFDERPHDIAAILIEPIQGEGGDRHFRAEFLQGLRRIADEREALLIFDEVQSGMGITGKWWAHEHSGIAPDIICFAKKMQVGGILVSERVDDVDNVFKVPSRISSTWGGSLVDMVRATRILAIIESEGLLENARLRGAELLLALTELGARFPALVSNVRGVGLMCAFDLPSGALRTRAVRAAFAEHLLLLPSGARTLRFRPFLNVDQAAIALLLERLSAALASLRGSAP